MHAVRVSWTFDSRVWNECARSGNAGRYISNDRGPNMESDPNIRSSFTGARFGVVTDPWCHANREEDFHYHAPVSWGNDSPPV
ncbi:hypothetical protein GCM10009838_45530 [Catenulispora subtropica]|uniref:Uncharacterized protein n=1 Tax=Catenulispora subtropica TaxID=450798 RepID=A0ABN2S2W1_9ACTN